MAGRADGVVVIVGGAVGVDEVMVVENDNDEKREGIRDKVRKKPVMPLRLFVTSLSLVYV